METTHAPVKVDVSPDVLVWARESMGLPVDSAAKKLGVKPATLIRMESGEAPVGIPKLRAMAKVYDRPLIAFFLSEPPEEAVSIADFRVIHESEHRSWSPELRRAYRRVVGQRQIALDLAATDERAIPIIDLHLRLTDDLEEAGDAMRRWLNPPVFTRRDPYTILNNWVALTEEKGVLVVQLSGVDIEEMRGFSIGEHPLPAIALNGSEFPRGKLFTLMHELVHILLRRSALCDLEDLPGAIDAEGQRLEWFCNSVAAATLMPRDLIFQANPHVAGSSQRTWSDEELMELSGQFGVSLEAMLVRLVNLNLASREFYRARRPAFQELYREQHKNGGGRLTYYPKQIRNLGRRYISTVWRAYERGDVSDPELSTYLQTKLENVPRLIKEAGLEA